MDAATTVVCLIVSNYPCLINTVLQIEVWASRLAVWEFVYGTHSDPHLWWHPFCLMNHQCERNDGYIQPRYPGALILNVLQSQEECVECEERWEWCARSARDATSSSGVGFSSCRRRHSAGAGPEGKVQWGFTLKTQLFSTSFISKLFRISKSFRETFLTQIYYNSTLFKNSIRDTSQCFSTKLPF